MKKTITRFPPSPTGHLHLGGARTALFNWLYARHMQGKFILRIEDTDVKRSTQAYTDAILDALTWLGTEWDEGPYFQSKRLPVYMQFLHKLLNMGNAYYCTCSPQKLGAMRKKALASGGKPKYDGTCRDKGLSQSEKAVIRFKAPLTGTTVLEDTVKGAIVFQNAELDDFILVRSDGIPTYNFAVVVDDVSMDINTIIRGDDHISNTPRQILLYKALGEPLPTYAHVPMVLGSDKTRLSKRHGAMSVTAYRDQGYLPHALINYLVRLGWSHGDQEFFSLEELIEKFSLENIGRSAGVFDPDKLLALNAEHLMAMPAPSLAEQALPFMQARGYQAEEGEYLEQVVQTLQPRSKTLTDMAERAAFYYHDEIVYDEAADRKFLTADTLPLLQAVKKQLERLAAFTEPDLEQAFKTVMADTGSKLGKIAQPVRVALTGGTASPGIFEIVAILGKDKVLARLEQAMAHIQTKGAGN